MKSWVQLTILALGFAAAGLAGAQEKTVEVRIQRMGATEMGPMGGPMGHAMDAPMIQQMRQVRMHRAHDEAQRQEIFKAQLKLTPSQEAAWAVFMAAIKPPHNPTPHSRPSQVEMAKLSTPERLEMMQSMHSKRMAEMTSRMGKRVEAVKAFYAQLSSDQQKVFDALSLHAMGRMMRGPHSGGRQGHDHGHLHERQG